MNKAQLVALRIAAVGTVVSGAIGETRARFAFVRPTYCNGAGKGPIDGVAAVREKADLRAVTPCRGQTIDCGFIRWASSLIFVQSIDLKLNIILVAALICGGQLSAHPVGQPEFKDVCQLGLNAVRVTTEGTELVYRYGTTNIPELTIHGSASSHNVFFRRDRWAHGEGQRLRFVNGAYSYILSSVFIAPG